MIEEDQVLDVAEETGFRLCCYSLNAKADSDSDANTGLTENEKVFAVHWDVNDPRRVFICSQNGRLHVLQPPTQPASSGASGDHLRQSQCLHYRISFKRFTTAYSETEAQVNAQRSTRHGRSNQGVTAGLVGLGPKSKARADAANAFSDERVVDHHWDKLTTIPGRPDELLFLIGVSQSVMYSGLPGLRGPYPEEPFIANTTRADFSSFIYGTPVMKLSGHSARVTSLACACSGEVLASGDESGTLRLLMLLLLDDMSVKVKAERKAKRERNVDSYRRMSMQPLAEDKATYRLSRRVHNGPLFSLCWLPLSAEPTRDSDSRRHILATASADRAVLLWRVACSTRDGLTITPLLSLSTTSTHALCLAASLLHDPEAERRLAVALEIAQIRIGSGNNGRPPRMVRDDTTFTGTGTATTDTTGDAAVSLPALAAEESAASVFLAAGTHTGSVYVWRIPAMSLLRELCDIDASDNAKTNNNSSDASKHRHSALQFGRLRDDGSFLHSLLQTADSPILHLSMLPIAVKGGEGRPRLMLCAADLAGAMRAYLEMDATAEHSDQWFRFDGDNGSDKTKSNSEMKGQLEAQGGSKAFRIGFGPLTLRSEERSEVLVGCAFPSQTLGHSPSDSGRDKGKDDDEAMDTGRDRDEEGSRVERLALQQLCWLRESNRSQVDRVSAALQTRGSSSSAAQSRMLRRMMEPRVWMWSCGCGADIEGGSDGQPLSQFKCSCPLMMCTVDRWPVLRLPAELLQRASRHARLQHLAETARPAVSVLAASAVPASTLKVAKMDRIDPYPSTGRIDKSSTQLPVSGLVSSLSSDSLPLPPTSSLQSKHKLYADERPLLSSQNSAKTGPPRSVSAALSASTQPVSTVIKADSVSFATACDVPPNNAAINSTTTASTSHKATAGKSACNAAVGAGASEGFHSATTITAKVSADDTTRKQAAARVGPVGSSASTKPPPERVKLTKSSTNTPKTATMAAVNTLPDSKSDRANTAKQFVNAPAADEALSGLSSLPASMRVQSSLAVPQLNSVALARQQHSLGDLDIDMDQLSVSTVLTTSTDRRIAVAHVNRVMRGLSLHSHSHTQSVDEARGTKSRIPKQVDEQWLRARRLMGPSLEDVSVLYPPDAVVDLCVTINSQAPPRASQFPLSYSLSEKTQFPRFENTMSIDDIFPPESETAVTLLAESNRQLMNAALQNSFALSTAKFV